MLGVYMVFDDDERHDENMDDILNDLTRMLDNFFSESPNQRGEVVNQKPDIHSTVRVDEENNSIRVVADVPGVSEDDVSVTVNNGTLQIAVPNATQTTKTAFSLPVDVVDDSGKATVNNGILEISLEMEDSEVN